MNYLSKFVATIGVVACGAQPLAAQDSAAPALKDTAITNLEGKVSGIEESYLATKATVDKLSKIKISGYIQTQVRAATDFKNAADTTGTGAINVLSNSKATSNPYGTYLFPTGNFSGGSFGTGVGSVLQLRRARIKVAYETDLTQAVVQLDCLPFTAGNAATGVTSTTTLDTVKKTAATTNTLTNSPFLTGGGVTIKDAYLRFTEPWLKSFAIKAGVFDRPFGFEIGYSSSSRESPERSRAEQTLFPGERDLGASLEYLPGDNLPLAARLFNLKGGVFTGNGINVENDDNRDVIGRLGMSIPLPDIGLGIDFGGSGYFGKIKDYNDTSFAYNSDGKKYVATTGQKNKGLDRQYVGADLQLYYDIPVIGGTTLRVEGYKGTQPCAKGSASSPSSNVTSSAPIYLRDFMGGYVMWVQNFGRKNQFVFKYDLWDPNTNITGSDIDSASIKTMGISTADLAFNTFGLGWVFHWDENVKLMLYYDIVKNEAVNDNLIKNKDYWVYTGAKAKDINANVLTFRIQYKF
jgi:hypothetical protein